MATRGKSARNKGHSFERFVVNCFKKIGWIGAIRRLEYQKEKALPGIDLEGTDPFSIQCKAHKDYVSVSTIKQIEKLPDKYNVLVTKGNNKPPMVVMDFEDFLEIVQMLKKEEIL